MLVTSNLFIREEIDSLIINENDNLINVIEKKFDSENLFSGLSNFIITSDMVSKVVDINISIEEVGATISYGLSSEVELNNYFDSPCEDITKDKLIGYKHFVENILKVPQGHSRINAFALSNKENGDLEVEILVVNKTNKRLKLPMIPILIEDKQGNVIANDSFKVNIKTKSNKISVYKLAIPKVRINTRENDLSEWKIQFSMKAKV